MIITGGASGIGESFVRAFVENGAKVAFLDLQREAGAALAASLGESEERPLFVPCDLTDTAALRAALGEIRAAFGPAAVLVNNAANDQRYKLDQITPEQQCLPDLIAPGDIGNLALFLASADCALPHHPHPDPRYRGAGWIDYFHPLALQKRPSFGQRVNPSQRRVRQLAVASDRRAARSVRRIASRCKALSPIPTG